MSRKNAGHQPLLFPNIYQKTDLSYDIPSTIYVMSSETVPRALKIVFLSLRDKFLKHMHITIVRQAWCDGNENSSWSDPLIRRPVGNLTSIGTVSRIALRWGI